MTRTLEITTNIGCNLGCPYCPQGALRSAWRRGERGRSARMTPERFASLLATVPTQVDVHFSGFAEPWHAPGCTRMVKHALSRGHRVAVFTTTDGMDDDDVAALAGLRFKRFVVHLPNATGELRVRLDDGYRERLLALRAGIANLELLTLGVPHPRVREWLRRTPFTRRVHSRAGNLSVASDQVGTAFTAEEITRRTAGTRIVCRKDRMDANVLLPDGTVLWCAMDYGLEHPLGNLSQQPWAEVADGPAHQALRSAMDTPDADLLCRRCEYAQPVVS